MRLCLSLCTLVMLSFISLVDVTKIKQQHKQQNKSVNPSYIATRKCMFDLKGTLHQELCRKITEIELFTAKCSASKSL